MFLQKDKTAKFTNKWSGKCVYGDRVGVETKK